jgi:hypothetical protein
VFLNERFPTTMRTSGVGFSWSVGFAIGGVAPTFTLLAAHTPAQLPLTLTAFLVGSSILYLIGGLLVPETRGRVNPE